MTIISHAGIRADVESIYRAGGLPRGAKTGWPSVDKLYTVGMNQWTIVTGNPGAGKSEWLDALMVNLAKTGEWRFFIYSPENHPVPLHHAKILEKYIGKPFNPGPTPRMEPDELSEGEDWMDGKFFFCNPNARDIESILVEAIDSIIGYGTTYKTGVVLDPWNYLEHMRPQWMSETEYVSWVLSNVLEHVRKFYMHMWLVAHPAKQQPKRDGSYSVPTPRDIAGSAHFWNKADNCITVHRQQSDEYNREVEIHVQKVRWKHMGRIGTTKLDYDLVTGRYREQLSVANHYSEREA
jgi:twinkle protein